MLVCDVVKSKDSLNNTSILVEEVAAALIIVGAVTSKTIVETEISSNKCLPKKLAVDCFIAKPKNKELVKVPSVIVPSVM